MEKAIWEISSSTSLFLSDIEIYFIDVLVKMCQHVCTRMFILELFILQSLKHYKITYLETT